MSKRYALSILVRPDQEICAEDFIIGLEDGGKFKSLRRHLMAKYALTPEQIGRNGPFQPTTR